jgi:hypothetical protein
MNKIYKFFCLTLMAGALLSSCQEDEKSPAKPGTVRFTLRQKAAANGRVTQALPEGARVLVSITTPTYEDIYNQKEIALVNMGGYFISEPLALDAGDYVLQELLVVSDRLLYVAPRQESPMAQWVGHALPIPFSVGNNNITGLEVEVLPYIEGHETPEDFGYAGFGIAVAPYPYFNLSVFGIQGHAMEFLAARAVILDGTDTVYHQSLPAGTNKIAFVGDMEAIYQLVLEAPGHARYTYDFTLPNVLEQLALSGKKAIEFTLSPAFTFVTRYNNEAAFRIEGAPVDELTIDWGDGTVEPYDEDDANNVTHEYAGDNAHYFVSVYGSDLDKIEELQFAYSGGSLNSITLDHLPALRKFRMVTAEAPSVVDFTHNANINHIELLLTNARSIVLAENATVARIHLDGNGNTFLTSAIDHVIDVSYRAAVEGRLPVGTLGLSTWYEQPVNPPRLIATPSPDALEKLRALRDVYGWHISPADF